jgi:hypothetical protein
VENLIVEEKKIERIKIIYPTARVDMVKYPFAVPSEKNNKSHLETSIKIIVSSTTTILHHHRRKRTIKEKFTYLITTGR